MLRLLMLITFVLLSASPSMSGQRFEAFKVDSIYIGPHAAPVLRTARERRFKTQLRNAAQQRVNFAGHYVLSTWGCGAGCRSGAAIDVRTGQVIWLPCDVEFEGIPRNAEPVEFRADSRLVVLYGMMLCDAAQLPSDRYYYKLQGNRFVRLSK